VLRADDAGRHAVAKQLESRLASGFCYRAFIRLQAEDGPDQLAQRLAAALTGMGSHAEAQDSVQRLLPMLQAFVADKKVLYVLDNVRSAAQLDALLPTSWGKGSVVIVSSKHAKIPASAVWEEVRPVPP
jgi:hypothetical protein